MKKDIVGKIFGMLTVLNEFKNERGYCVCECRCECGTVKSIYKGNITSGRTKSCGCLEEKNRKKFKDLAGKRFGKLVAITPTDQRKGGNIVWKCDCDCGGTAYVSGRNLVRGFTKSCGCYLLDKRDITNHRFGKLTALYPDERLHKGSQKWICLCDCGKRCSVCIANLRNGHTQSCGCLMREEHRVMIDGTCLNIIMSDKVPKNSRSGIKGVSYYSRTNSWAATLTFQGKRYYLGKYANVMDAAKARWAAEEEIVRPFIEEHQHLIKENTSLALNSKLRVAKFHGSSIEEYEP